MDKEQMRSERLEFFRSQAEEYHYTREYSKAMTFYVRAGLLGDLDSVRPWMVTSASPSALLSVFSDCMKRNEMLQYRHKIR